MRNDIAEFERNIRTNRDEADKLNSELEALKEQVKKQNDTHASIGAAWEKAEAEAKALEADIESINQIGW